MRSGGVSKSWISPEEEVIIKRYKFVTLCVSMMLLPVVAAAKKPRGKISDVAAFSQIHYYCIDSRDLADDEALDVRNFVSDEKKPKKLLSQLPWTLVADCSRDDVDAVVRMEFQKFAPLHDDAPAEGESFTIRAILRVSQGSSSTVLYEVQAAPSNNSLTGHSMEHVNDPLAVQRRDAIYSAFWMLTEDVQRVSQMSPKR